MAEKKLWTRTYSTKESSASLPRLHTCENKVPLWDFKEFAVTESMWSLGFNPLSTVTISVVLWSIYLYSSPVPIKKRLVIIYHCILNILIGGFFTSNLTDGFPLEMGRPKVSLGLQKNSKCPSRFYQCRGPYCFNSSSNPSYLQEL